MSFKVPEKFRITTGKLGSDSSYGCNGAFYIDVRRQTPSFVIASNQFGWEHVSVSVSPEHSPSWELMCKVKDLFWDEEDCVVQYHPPRSDYKNLHPHCLHMWREVGMEFNRPPSWMVA